MAQILPLLDEHTGFLADESRYCGTASTIAFPTTEDEIVEIIRAMQASHCPITVQGARTGITGGAVPSGGHVMNLSRMTTISPCRYDAARGEHYVTVQPGTLLMDIRTAVESAGLFFPPDPTETSASIGGMVACNASGALSYHYGATRHWIRALHIVLANGSVLTLRRGECVATGRTFSLVTQDGAEIAGVLPTYTMPHTKNAAGYYVADDMDLLDLFIGMEGTLGIISEIELRLLPRPAAVVGLMLYFPTEAVALQFVHQLRASAHQPVALEFFDHQTLQLLRRSKAELPAFSDLPTLRPHYHTAIYCEFHGTEEPAVEEEALSAAELAMALGVSDEDSWYAGTPRELHAQKLFRHAVPEAVNLLIDTRRKTVPGLRKLGTDMSVPDHALDTVMAMYRQDLQATGLESVLFGHIGNNHIHVNILPHSLEEYARGQALYLAWAERVVALGGSISAEHGIGKLKASFLPLMSGTEAIEQMATLKACFAADGLFNPGNMLPCNSAQAKQRGAS